MAANPKPTPTPAVAPTPLVDNAPAVATELTPPTPAQLPPVINISMTQPQAGEPTEGLSEIVKGGRFIIRDPDPSRPGKFTEKTVDAQGQPLKD